MTATEELHLPDDAKELDALLDERGQAHRVWPSGLVIWHDERTVYEYEPAKNHHDEYWGGILRMTMHHLTPEQVIDATLGRGTCRDVADTPQYGDKTRFECSECGYEYSAVGGFGCDYGDEPDFRFCPNCGREVVSE